MWEETELVIYSKRLTFYGSWQGKCERQTHGVNCRDIVVWRTVDDEAQLWSSTKDQRPYSLRRLSSNRNLLCRS